jgi:hypothetical protein
MRKYKKIDIKQLIAMFLGISLPTSAVAQGFPQAQLPKTAPTTQTLGNMARGVGENYGVGGAGQLQPQSLPPRVELCRREQVVGLWKMEALYEVPEGEEQKGFQKSPHRYLELMADGIYQGVSGTQQFTDYTGLKMSMVGAMGKDTWQHVLDGKGVLYVYKNRAVNSTFHCGIAMETKGGYKTGDMILTPTTKGATQVFRQYRKITLP